MPPAHEQVAALAAHDQPGVTINSVNSSSPKFAAPPSDEMWYDFGSVRSLDFDERYRFAQLPLLAPNHPLAINTPADEDYECGRYATPKYSLALPIPHSELERSNAYQALLRDIQSRAFSPKIDHELVARRRDRLHVTIVGKIDPGAIAETVRIASDILTREVTGFRMLGPFIGTFNTGRIYFPLLAQTTPRGCWLDRIHRAFGHDPASFHGMGYFNFVDELDENESRDLADFIGTWKHVTMFEGVARRLQIMATNDDLALSARTISMFPS